MSPPNPDCSVCGGTGEIGVHCLFDLGGGDHDDCDDPNCIWRDIHPCNCTFAALLGVAEEKTE